MQVNVINKTKSLHNDKQLSDEFIHLIQNETPRITLKTDGTCGLIMKIGDNYTLMRRQDIRVYDNKKKSLNKDVDRLINDSVLINNYRLGTIMRQYGKVNKEVPFYMFNLGKDTKPEIEVTHLIGFTPVDEENPNDKYIKSCFKNNNTPDLEVYCSVPSNTLDVPVNWFKASDLVNDVLSVEIIGSKISNRYNFKSDQHFINIHGSIEVPNTELPSFEYDDIYKWFRSDSQWADNEGIVIHFLKAQKRFKFHVGYFDMGEAWKKKKSCGLNFIFE